ncbi:MAG: hypothetical protein U1E42_09690 [Rhodospirillales bacterium]
MYTRDAWQAVKGDRPDTVVSVERADPAAVIRRVLGGFPVADVSAELTILAWVMTLPPDLNPSLAARSLLAGRLPCCRMAPSTTMRDVRDLLRFVASQPSTPIRPGRPTG